MTDTDKKQPEPQTQRRVTYAYAGGGLCEVELYMSVKDSERHLRMKREEISRYYADLDPARSIIETDRHRAEDVCERRAGRA